jgi:hypothetical protein
MNAVSAVRQIRKDQNLKATTMKNFKDEQVQVPVQDMARKALKSFRFKTKVNQIKISS